MGEMIQKDKIKHFLAGLALSLLAGLFVAPIYGVWAAVLVGAAKELLYDGLLNKGTVEWWDFVATALGGACGYLIFGLLGVKANGIL